MVHSRKESAKRYSEKNRDKILAYQRDYYKKNKEKIRIKGKEHYQRNWDKIQNHRKIRYNKLKQEFLLKYKIGKCCSLCDWKEHPEILQFHHKDNKEKEFTIGNIKVTERSTPNNIKKIQEEINKCILLCPNCHAKLHYLIRKNRIK